MASASKRAKTSGIPNVNNEWEKGWVMQWSPVARSLVAFFVWTQTFSFGRTIIHVYVHFLPYYFVCSLSLKASAPSVAPIATVNTNEATTEEDEWRVIPIERLQVLQDTYCALLVLLSWMLTSFEWILLSFSFPCKSTTTPHKFNLTTGCWHQCCRYYKTRKRRHYNCWVRCLPLTLACIAICKLGIEMVVCLCMWFFFSIYVSSNSKVVFVIIDFRDIRLHLE